MSTRNIRKLAKKLQKTSLDQAQATDGVADEEFEPLYTTKQASNYEGLELQTPSSDGEAGPTSESKMALSDEAQHVVAVEQKKKNKNNRKKRNKNKKNETKQADKDEISKVLAEVNELLGTPEDQDLDLDEIDQDDQSPLLKIDYKHLNVRNELKRLFGPDDDEARRQQRRPNLRLARRQIVLTNATYNFTAKGLSMTLVEVKCGLKYFKFEHGATYQKHMHTLVEHMKVNYHDAVRGQALGFYKSDTVEALIENVDLYFRLEENAIANNMLEQAINFMQNTFDPAFNYVDGETRLEYRHVENRVFHITLLKYLHLLTNKACHRTALEIAKLMLNLDPKDPLGVIFIMDTLALRAREHQWLADIYERLSVEREATRLFHLKYSHALALYHLYLQNHEQVYLATANRLIRAALIQYPNVAVMIMDHCKEKNEVITNHRMFNRLAKKTTSTDLLSLQILYAKFVWPKWREGDIMKWLISNALDVIHKYDNDPSVKLLIKKEAQERSRLFRKYPIEIKRHLSVISPMSQLLVEGMVPPVEKTLSINPYPNQGSGVDIHRYFAPWGLQTAGETLMTPLQRGILRSFINSLIPTGLPTLRNLNDEMDV